MKLVAFLDILGFRSLINEYSFNEYYNRINHVVKSLEALSGNFDDGTIKDKKIRIEQKARSEILKKINLDIISDSLILTLDISTAENIINATWEEHNVEAEYLFLFFSWISNFRVFFMIATKYLLRGGITCGEFQKKHLDAEITNSTILYGKGIVRAAEIEKNVDLARIELDKQLGEKWLSLKNVFKEKKLVSDVVKKEETNKYFLNSYYCMINSSGQQVVLDVQKMLTERQKKYSKEFFSNPEKKNLCRVYQKWVDFIKNHNEETVALWGDNRFVVKR